MKKFIIAIAVIIGIPFVFMFFYLNILAKGFIESRGSRILGTEVNVGLVSISPFSGSITLHGIEVKSPKGFSAENVFKLSGVYVKMKLFSIYDDTIIIDRLDIENPEITYEFGALGHNVNVLSQNAANRGEENTYNNDPYKKVIIKETNIIGGKVNLKTNLVNINNKQTLPLPDIHLQGIGEKENGILFRDALVQILQHVATELPKLDFKAIGEQLKSITNEFKGNVEVLKNYLGR